MPVPAHTAHLLEQYFDKIFVVSVPRFTDRHDMVKQQLAGLSFDFFWGVDKQELNIETLIQQNIYNEQNAIKNQRRDKALNSGEIACALSHRKVYEEMIKWGWRNVLIFEDDVFPLQHNLPLLENVLKELPANWELLYLGYLKHEKVTAKLRLKQFFYKIGSSLGLMKWSYTMVCNLLPKPYTPHLKKAGFHDCTHAYAVSLAGAKKLLEAQTPIVYRADDALSATTLKGLLNAFVTQPKFFDQMDFHNSTVISHIKS